MKIKSSIAALIAVFTLGLTTSCEDIFDVPSNRVVYDHEINSTSDSVYTTLGVLQCMRKVADRYVILGEVRGDMAVVNEYTKTSLRNLANFNFDSDNEYLNVRDYYAIINNCNYALAKMDTALAINNQRVMLDEYAALQGIRAWTYLQLAINYDTIPYYTHPVVTEDDVEKVYAEGKKDIKAITEDLAPRLIPYLDYDLPAFVNTQGNYPVLRLVLADLYLWSGDYENAAACLKDYFMNNKKRSYTATDGKNPVTQPGYFSLGGRLPKSVGRIMSSTDDEVFLVANFENSNLYFGTNANENLAYIRMEESAEDGLVSEVGSLFTSTDNKHPLYPSASWEALSAKQTLFLNQKKDNDSEKDTLYTFKNTRLGGDVRYSAYYTSYNEVTSDEGEKLTASRYNKFSGFRINIYRRSIACLRWAEALNALAKEQFVEGGDSLTNAPARANALNAFYLLKDASKVFFPENSEVRKKFSRFEKEIQEEFVGVHSRGCLDVALDTNVYVLKPEVIAARLGEGRTAEDLCFQDTIQYIDELIIDELALESTLEGNRFGDLIRFAKRREAWGDDNYRAFLATRVADRGVNEEEPLRDEELYNKLNDTEDYWYLPFK